MDTEVNKNPEKEIEDISLKRTEKNGFKYRAWRNV
jgi:hypothetical protein